ncbi:MAG: helix-turn-helix transcriptional regulator, partial [Sciscionella sp.]
MATGQHRAGLAIARKAAGLTQEDLAAALRVERSTVVRWEAGRHAPQSHLWPELATLLGLTLSAWVPCWRTHRQRRPHLPRHSHNHSTMVRPRHPPVPRWLVCRSARMGGARLPSWRSWVLVWFMP